jgi:GlpG protein
MRLIWSSIHPEAFKKACHTLETASIAYLGERKKNMDWGSDYYGETFLSIWIVNENDVARAEELLQPEQKVLFLRDTVEAAPKVIKKNSKKCFVTYICIALSFLLFMVNEYESLIAPTTAYQTSTSFSPLNKTLLFDYPKAVELEDSIIEGESVATQVDEKQLTELEKASYWGGFSLTFFAYISKIPFIPHPSDSIHYLFEKISQGQIWRLITPIFLHGSIIHILFNMTWAYILGTQMELRMGYVKYILFILVTAILSNTAQYLMSGYAFIGFSGVLFAMAGFIAQRARLAPFEQYTLEKSVYTYLKVFMWALVGISVVTYVGECYYKKIFFSLGFANTAHVVGLLTGCLIGRYTRRNHNAQIH